MWPRTHLAHHALRRLAAPVLRWQNGRMTEETLNALLKLSPDERAEIAMALWSSLEDPELEARFALDPGQVAELERRLSEHLADPTSAVPWEDVRRRITGQP